MGDLLCTHPTTRAVPASSRPSTEVCQCFPVGTLVVNLLGSLILGFIARGALETAAFSPETRAGLTIGLCGGFTTMSSFAYESLALMGDGQYGRAGVYCVTTTIGSVLAAAVGAAVAQKLG